MVAARKGATMGPSRGRKRAASSSEFPIDRGGPPKVMKTLPLAYARGSVQFPAQNRDRQGAASSTERLDLSP